MTYRDRRLDRAERLREWASKREVKGAAQLKEADAKASLIPFGQPTMTDHHSYKRDTNYRAGIRSGFSRGVENLDKASDMRARAANITEAADNAIYSDDPDAVQRLAERIASLEAKREQYKAENAAYRNAHPEIRTMTPWEKDQVLPRPSYSAKNLSADINRNKKRLALLQAKAERESAS